MDSQDFKIRARLDPQGLSLRIQLNHPMETGQRKDAAGQLVPAHFIQHIRVLLNDVEMVEVDCGQGVSANPLFAFRFNKAKAGDRLQINWYDSQGVSRVETILLG